MEKERYEDRLYTLINPILEKMGYTVVELHSNSIHKRLHVNLIIFNPDGISIDNCSVVYKTVLPRIEAAENTREIHLEVSSPGLGRVIKNPYEFIIFRNKIVNVLLKSTGKWESGIIENMENNILLLKSDTTTIKIDCNDIQKAKLE